MSEVEKLEKYYNLNKIMASLTSPLGSSSLKKYQQQNIKVYSGLRSRSIADGDFKL
jgi:hypothetical protein